METGEIEIINGRRNRRPIKYEISRNDCWNCISHYKLNGYPMIRINKKHTRMSRYIYEQSFGEITNGMNILHSCDNPACINLKHLRLGTQQDNMNDKVKRDRFSHTSGCKGESHGMSKLTQIQVDEIRKDTRSLRTIAKDYGVSNPQIGNIKKYKSWGTI